MKSALEMGRVSRRSFESLPGSWLSSGTRRRRNLTGSLLEVEVEVLMIISTVITAASGLDTATNDEAGLDFPVSGWASAMMIMGLVTREIRRKLGGGVGVADIGFWYHSFLH